MRAFVGRPLHSPRLNLTSLLILRNFIFLGFFLFPCFCPKNAELPQAKGGSFHDPEVILLYFLDLLYMNISPWAYILYKFLSFHPIYVGGILYYATNSSSFILLFSCSRICFHAPSLSAASWWMEVQPFIRSYYY